MNTGCRMRFYVIKEGSVVSKRHKHNYTAEKTEELTFNQFDYISDDHRTFHFRRDFTDYFVDKEHVVVHN